eukprot:7456391-Pyramimonas_sp.AAC.1
MRHRRFAWLQPLGREQVPGALFDRRARLHHLCSRCSHRRPAFGGSWLFFLRIFLLGRIAPWRAAALEPIRGLRIPPGFRGRPSVNVDAR